MALKRTELCDAVVGGFDLVVSRTGYTGEKMAFELFVHPDRAADLFKALLQAGGPLGSNHAGWARVTACAPKPGCRCMGMKWVRAQANTETRPGCGRRRVWLVCQDL